MYTAIVCGSRQRTPTIQTLLRDQPTVGSFTKTLQHHQTSMSRCGIAKKGKWEDNVDDDDGGDDDDDSGDDDDDSGDDDDDGGDDDDDDDDE